jgi:hypothetical protein
MDKITITKVLLLKNRSLTAGSVRRVLTRDKIKLCESRKCGGIAELESNWDTADLKGYRPLWLCLIDNVALTAPAPEDATTFEDILLPLVEEQGSLVDLFEARAAIRMVKLIFQHERWGSIQEKHCFSSGVLSLDQMVQLTTLVSAPLVEVSVRCEGVGPFSLYGNLKEEGNVTRLHLCNNLGRYVSDPIKTSEIGKVKFLSHWQLSCPVFIEII